MARYEMTIKFDTNADLTFEELEHLLFECRVQIEEPSDYRGENKRARFTTEFVSAGFGEADEF